MRLRATSIGHLVCPAQSGDRRFVRRVWNFCPRPLKGDNHEHDKNEPEEVAKVVSRAPASARSHAGVEHVALKLGQQLEPILSDAAARERVVLTMNSTLSTNLTTQAPAYVALQHEMHNALRAQHPDWIKPNSDCPTCDSYEPPLAHFFLSLVHSSAGTSQPRSKPAACNHARRLC